jgi:hypothetical protein
MNRVLQNHGQQNQFSNADQWKISNALHLRELLLKILFRLIPYEFSSVLRLLRLFAAKYPQSRVGHAYKFRYAICVYIDSPPCAATIFPRGWNTLSFLRYLHVKNDLDLYQRSLAKRHSGRGGIL